MSEEPEGGEASGADALVLRASIARGSQDHRKALALLDAAEALDANDALIWVVRGDVHRDRSLLDRAEECYRRALELDPTLTEVEEKLALVSLGKLQSAQLQARAAQGGAVQAEEIKKRSQTAMLLSLLLPGLGHLRYEYVIHAAVLGSIHIAGLAVLAILGDKSAGARSVGEVWTMYGVVAALTVNYVFALYDASRKAATRPEEDLL